MPSPRPTPTATKLAWRAEELPDGSVEMTVGDVDAAPRDPRALNVADYRAPADVNDCDQVQVVSVRGWWCTTKVKALSEDGEIVVSGGPSRARLSSAGFATRCSGRRPGRMRELYQIERDSWSGWRDYTGQQPTEWTASKDQTEGPVSAPCPLGRVGTYDYRVAVTLDVEGLRVGDSPAASTRVRVPCGTGTS
ncbi:hypothetical protein Airi02_034400 [Actinoallomurus iriomotensis]|uniref:Uncharacterized protein n=1 Tax=Actinoallomurus iriomotensis TaxID=478107 RepID=A0A9W6RZ82_9ACTN|nr:hypothetical protein Airi02_034400 [Actinoallomurus iriomotensis]